MYVFGETTERGAYHVDDRCGDEKVARQKGRLLSDPRIERQEVSLLG